MLFNTVGSRQAPNYNWSKKHQREIATNEERLTISSQTVQSSVDTKTEIIGTIKMTQGFYWDEIYTELNSVV